MFLKHMKTGHTIEVMDLVELSNPCDPTISGREHFGEEVQAPETYNKRELLFLSEEPLPRCWTDPDYTHLARMTGRGRPEAEEAGYHGA